MIFEIEIRVPIFWGGREVCPKFSRFLIVEASLTEFVLRSSKVLVWPIFNTTLDLNINWTYFHFRVF